MYNYFILYRFITLIIKLLYIIYELIFLLYISKKFISIMNIIMRGARWRAQPGRSALDGLRSGVKVFRRRETQDLAHLCGVNTRGHDET